MNVEKPFFARDTETIAKDLLGCVLCRKGMKGRIVETEAYLEDDPASHAYPKKTERNRLMYETHGRVYIYLCYGIHHMLNFTTEKDGVGGVLIRSLEPLEGVNKMRQNRGVEEKKDLCSGPGKICEALEISKEMNGTEVGEKLEIERETAERVEASTRIGINKSQNRELRYYIPYNSFVSR
ncbi:MAG: DNA-3-methyladenine glycosylase [Candidatus Nanohaloarchaea archaeon]|jgi:DNA-3-methyladenine glycosylase